MDFFSLLKNKPNTNKNIEPPKIEHDKKTIVPLYNLEEIEFKKGETVKVVRLENSILNSYKGYIGTIRDSVKNNSTCMVVLDGLNSGAAIRFPKTHLVKI